MNHNLQPKYRAYTRKKTHLYRKCSLKHHIQQKHQSHWNDKPQHTLNFIDQQRSYGTEDWNNADLDVFMSKSNRSHQYGRGTWFQKHDRHVKNMHKCNMKNTSDKTKIPQSTATFSRLGEETSLYSCQTKFPTCKFQVFHIWLRNVALHCEKNHKRIIKNLLSKKLTSK